MFLYENFLSQKNSQLRKSLGVFYTPKFIADYMVKNSIDLSIENKSYEEICQIKIIDPACGGGIFLVWAFEYLQKIHKTFFNQEKLDFYQKNKF